ncbi:hypothetical protein Avbf_13381, partial [Armadillidium vulgare]
MMSRKNFTKNTGYVQQEDLFIGTMKVKNNSFFRYNFTPHTH